jgi:hypothetical protein
LRRDGIKTQGDNARGKACEKFLKCRNKMKVRRLQVDTPQFRWSKKYTLRYA